MFSVIYFIVSVLMLYNCIHSYNIRNVNIETDLLRNNLEMLLRPIKKLTGIFPNHEIEIQFDVDQNPQEKKLRRRANTNNNPSSMTVSSSTSSSVFNVLLSSSPPNRKSSTTTADQDNQIVYMKDLKKALEDYEQKHSNTNCNKSPQSKEKITSTVQNSNSIRLSSILNLLKNSKQMHQDISLPNEEELSWLKIRVPS